MQRQQLVDERISALRSRFVQRARDDRAALQLCREQNDRVSVRDLAHRLAGVAATFGFPEIGNAAFEVQDALDRDKSEDALAEAVDRLIDLLDLAD